jgi:DNA-binding helix-hairpin-helix protein with protein kinase domain
MPLERAIAECRFAYSSRRFETHMDPPPNVPLLSDVPPYIAGAFEKTFGKGSLAGGRPSAAEWIALLEKAETEIVVCSANDAHHYFKVATSCPWCRMEHTAPGFTAFNPHLPTILGPTVFDFNALQTMLAGLKDPGPPPDLVRIASVPQKIKPPSEAVRRRNARRTRVGVGAVGTIGGICLFSLGGAGFFAGVIVIAGSTSFAFAQHQRNNDVVAARQRAEAAWNAVQSAWSQQAGNKSFLTAEAEAEKHMVLLGRLPEREKHRLQELNNKKREAQLLRYLERFRIGDAKIRKIGPGRKMTLASFGIETAADVQRPRIEAIQGFGPTLTSALLAWRQLHAARFVYRANGPLDPRDVQLIKSEINKERSELEKKFRHAIAKAQQVAAAAISQRTNLLASANAALRNLRQAQVDEQFTTGVLK